jgi:hypothetical protein
MRLARFGPGPTGKALAASAAILAGLSGAKASGQGPARAEPTATAPTAEDRAEIVIVGTRGSVVTDVAPLAMFDADAIEATGAASMAELLTAIRATTQSADGSEPIFLLNGQRVSGYPEIGSLPPEAIEKVEVLPEQAALRFGFPPTRRVVNFITRQRFRQVEVRASAGTTTRWGSATEKANLGVTRLHNGSRLTLGLEYRRTDPLYLSDRDIRPDPDIPFDALGNITGASGGEIAPALSAAAGRRVTIVPVPENPADRTLAGFAAGANAPRLFDLDSLRTLTPRNDTIKAEAVVADRIGARLAGSISLSAEQSRDRSLAGPAAARLLLPATSPFSPFGAPVILNRYLTEADGLHQRETVTTLQAGATLRGAIAGWRWDVTGALSQKQTDGRSERGIDPAAANAAIAAGADPFAPFDPGLLAGRLTDRTRLRTRNAAAKSVITNSPIVLPAGRVTVTATAEAERSTASSSSRGANLSALQLGRGRVEAGLAIDVPLASRRFDALAFVGELSVNASVSARRVGGFGTLADTTFGAAWSPIEGLQLLATVKNSQSAPDIAQQLTPAARIENVPVFDYGKGRTAIVTLILGGNPDLAAEHRLVRSLALTAKPFANRELRLSATYEITRIRNQFGNVYAITPLTEAILPDLFVRDASGRLVSVAFRPINFSLARRRVLNMTVNASGKIGKAPPALTPGGGPPPQQVSYYGGIGPSIKFSDRLQLRPGTPELDLLAGDTIQGGGTARVYGYAYGGINFYGYGFTFNAWRAGGSRIRSADPASDLRFSSQFRLNLGAHLSLGRVLKHDSWARRFRISLDVSNATEHRQRVRDRNGIVPNRYQPDLLDPIGRTVTLTLRKLF